MTRKGRSAAAFIVSLQLLQVALGAEVRMEAQFEHCCSLGSTWAAQGLKCEKFVGPVAGVLQVEQSLCLEAVDVCCVRSYRKKQCELGKNHARAGSACFTSSRPSSGDYQRDCCEGCKLGILTGSMGQGCAFKKFAFGDPWDPAFLECCHEAYQSTTADSTSTVDDGTSWSTTDDLSSKSTTSAVSPSSNFPASPIPAQDDLCQLMKGMLCSDICIPTPGSFICACNEGFTLLEDGKTCRQDSSVNRCKKDNPCEQHCTDTGEAIVCTCDPGFVLADDKHSCKPKSTDTTPFDGEKEPRDSCPTGYRYNISSQICTDIDECESNVCPTGRCKNTLGSFICTSGGSNNVPYEACPPGYKWNPEEHYCVDIDECIQLPLVCNSETHVCVNSQGSFNCHELTGTGPKSCPAGFKYDSLTKNCKDVDECAEGIHSCLPDTEECRNTDGAFECKIKCQKGLSFSGNLGTCVDVDECAINGSLLCPEKKSICVNTIGGYECRNPNEAVQPIQGNPQSHRANVASSCPAGYKPTTNPNEPCVDVNECNEQLHSCEQTEQCVNEIGSYRCDSLLGDSVEEGEISEEDYDKSGYTEYPIGGQRTEVDQEEDISEVVPTCIPGYVYNYDTERCNDINECLTNQHNCTGRFFQCHNLPGTFRCDCQSGYEMNNTTRECEDIDECARGLTECSSGERCINFIGGHQCSPACSSGFQPHPTDESLCQDIDECALGIHSCPANSHVCVNTNGSFVCDVAAPCQKGYARDQVSGQCIDVDECAVGPGCRDHERCRNLPGSYDCVPLCGRGWLFNTQTKSCQDVDECLLGRHDCPQNTHTCVNTNGSFTCSSIPPCRNGYRKAENGSCMDVDECLENVHNCLSAHHQYCVNTEGGFECSTRLPACDSGYEYSLNTRRCEDVDECASRQNTCNRRAGERCINVPGTYRCERPARSGSQQRQQLQPSCPTGFMYDAQRRQCLDIDECAEDQQICGNKVCHNHPGGHTCVPEPVAPRGRCGTGMKISQNGCVDINECLETEDACNSNEQCLNTPGSFTCSCMTGFRRDNFTGACVDINECQIQEYDCLPSQRCDNTIGSYTCVRFLSCGTGYTLNAVYAICEDDDECALGTHDCGEGYYCRNTQGSYRCFKSSRLTSTTLPPRLQRPYVVPITTTRAPALLSPLIVCPLGFQASGAQCVDVNECESLPGVCSRRQKCVNTLGSYRCISRLICSSGYTLDASEQHCVDIDECAERTHGCGRGQTCENRKGGYACKCPPGHISGPNNDCVDIDECSLYRNICGNLNSQCENTVGSYRCICNDGFDSVAGDTGCEDVNECKRNPGLCQHDCINFWGSYRCSCKPGYRLNSDNRSCSDIDECTEFKGSNLCVGICENTPGSYSCQCPNGYRLGTDGRTCLDIDECATEGECRGPRETCQNTRGSFRCNRIDCPVGYKYDTEAKNRCMRISPYCQTGDQSCLRSPSYYSYNFMTMVSMMPLSPVGQLELFTMRSAHSSSATVQFGMSMADAKAPPGIVRATESCFKLRRPSRSQAVLVLTQSIPGPQEIELDLSMEIYNGNYYVGSTIAKLFIIVSEYEF